MKLATWNINSIRARTDRLVKWLAAEQPDILCLQETKVEDAGFPQAAVNAAGYDVVAPMPAAVSSATSRSRQPGTVTSSGSRSHAGLQSAGAPGTCTPRVGPMAARM